MPKEEETRREKVKSGVSFLYRKMVDSGDEVRKLAKAVKDDALYAYYNQAKASMQTAQNWISVQQSDEKGDKVGKSLAEIFRPIKAKGDDYFIRFQSYLYNRHNIDRMGTKEDKQRLDAVQEQIDSFDYSYPEIAEMSQRDLVKSASMGDAQAQERVRLLEERDRLRKKVKPVFGFDVSADDSRARVHELEGLHPEFKGLAEEVYDYTKNLMKLRVEAGLVTEDLARNMERMYPHYVPTYRMQEEQENGSLSENARIGKTVKRAEGGKEKLIPIDVALAKQTFSTIRETSKNRFGKRLLNPDIPGSFILQTEKSGKRENESLEDLWEDNFSELLTDNTFTVFRDGTAFDVVMTPELFDAVRALYPSRADIENAVFVKALRSSNNMYKALITSKNPVFLVKNFVKDIQDALFYSTDLKGFAKNYPKAWKEIAENGEIWRQYQALGGTASGMYNDAEGISLPETGAKGAWKKLTDRIEYANLVIEQSPRLAEFMAQREKDSSQEGLMKAMLAAADITTNFSRNGEWGKILNRSFVPFLNPSIQGADKIMRTIRDGDHTVKGWLCLAARCAALGIAPAILNYILCGDEDDWDELRQDDKDMNYLFKIGDGIWLKIPRGRVLSVFAALANGGTRLTKGQDVNAIGIAKLALEQVGPVNPLEDNIMKAWMDADLLDSSSPGKTWYGSDLESQRLRSMKPGERYDESTDVVSKAIGGKLNVSPKKINYLLDAYTGVIGDLALPLLTPTKTTGRNPIVKGFTLDSVMSNDLSEKFYNKSDELTWSKNAGDGQASVTLKYWNKVKDQVSDLNQELRELENDKGLSTKAKRDAVREKKAEINAVYRGALATLDDYQKAVDKNYTGSGDDEISMTYLKANHDVLGAETALRMEGKDAYAKAREAVEAGTTWEGYYDFYASTRGLESTEGNSIGKQKLDELENMKMDSNEKAALWYGSMLSDSQTEKWSGAISSGASKVDCYTYYSKSRGIVSTEDASETVQKMDVLRDMDASEEAKAALYYADICSKDKLEEVEALTGISKQEFYAYVQATVRCKGETGSDGKTVSGSKKKQILAEIQKLPLTNAQKDILYYFNGWSSKTISDAPWH